MNPAANPTSNPQTLLDSSCDMRTLSLHEYAQLAGYLQTRVLPGAPQTASSPEEESLSPDLKLFLSNMKQIDVAKSQSNNSHRSQISQSN